MDQASLSCSGQYSYLSGTGLPGEVCHQLHEDDVEEAVDGHGDEDVGVSVGADADGVAALGSQSRHH